MKDERAIIEIRWVHVVFCAHMSSCHIQSWHQNSKLFVLSKVCQTYVHLTSTAEFSRIHVLVTRKWSPWPCGCLTYVFFFYPTTTLGSTHIKYGVKVMSFVSQFAHPACMFHPPAPAVFLRVRHPWVARATWHDIWHVDVCKCDLNDSAAYF